MATAPERTDLKARCRRVRADIIGLLDWIESELEHHDTRPPDQCEPLSDRHHWILDQLRDGKTVTRETVECQFGLHEKQAKRVLAELTKRNLAEFVRAPRPGHYTLRTRATPSTASPTSAIDTAPGIWPRLARPLDAG